MNRSTGALVRVALVCAGGVAAATAMSLAAVPGRGAAQFAPRALDLRAAEWRDAARLHAAGRFDEPAASIARWPPELTRVVLDRVIRRARDPRAPDDTSGGSDHEASRASLAKGLLLHTDIAIAERTSPTAAGAGSRAWTVLDAKPLERRRFSAHWGFAGLLAEALAKDAAGAPVARAWFRAVGALYQQWADLGQLHAHLAAGADVLTDDPVLLLQRGTLHQAYADARVQSYLAQARQPRGGMPNRFVQTVAIAETDTELGHAERALRRALAIDPSLVEARIRLAHVLGERGRAGDAAALVQQALASPLPPFLEYYGAMVLGRNEVRLGRRAEARAAYERAVARYPRSQAVRVALSHLDLTEGRPGDGIAALMQALGPGAPAQADDPWSWYFRRHEPDAQARLDELRRSLP
jgi:tetratricopeptide (TPR) repeat protein